MKLEPHELAALQLACDRYRERLEALDLPEIASALKAAMEKVEAEHDAGLGFELAAGSEFDAEPESPAGSETPAGGGFAATLKS